MGLKKSLAKKSKGHFKYESMLKAMPPDIVKELARRRLEEIERYQEDERSEKNITAKK
jgi:hypothetical protein